MVNALISSRAGQKQPVVYLLLKRMVVEIKSVEKGIKIMLHYYVNNLNGIVHL